MLETIAILCLVYFGLWYIGWFAGGVCTNSKRLDDKIVVITGGNTGIGYETALDLARRGATIIMGCRDVKKAQKAAEKIKTVTKEVVHVIPLDLASLASVRKFAEEIKALTTKVDILINNAGSKLYRVSQQFWDRDYLKIKRDEKFVKVYLCSS